jgi:hypothetical protein
MHDFIVGSQFTSPKWDGTQQVFTLLKWKWQGDGFGSIEL